MVDDGGGEMTDIKETDKAYLAGLFDGEGCVAIAKCNSKRTPTPIYSLIVVITNSQRDFLDYYRSLTNLGSVKTDKNISHSNWRSTHQWWITSKQAKIFLELIYPYLKIKREQVDIAFAFRNTFIVKGGWYGKTKKGVKGGDTVPLDIIHQRERYYQTLSALKKS